MKCSLVRKRLMDYVTEELTASDLPQVRSHLADCDACRRELECVRQASEALLTLREEEQTPDLLRSVRQSIAANQSRPILVPRLAVACSILVVGVLIAAGWLWHTPAPEGMPVAEKREMQSPAPQREIVVKQPSAPSPAPVIEHRWQMEKPRRTPRMLVKHTPERKPAQEKAVVPDPAPDPEVEMAPEADTGEPEMLFVLQPREPESYMIRVSAEEESPASEISVVREFSTGGAVTSVTIDQTEVPDMPDPDAPDPGTTRLMDATPVDEVETGSIDSGGYTQNA